jgi:hypothetical protein
MRAHPHARACSKKLVPVVEPFGLVARLVRGTILLIFGNQGWQIGPAVAALTAHRLGGAGSGTHAENRLGRRSLGGSRGCRGAAAGPPKLISAA